MLRSLGQPQQPSEKVSAYSIPLLSPSSDVLLAGLCHHHEGHNGSRNAELSQPIVEAVLHFLSSLLGTKEAVGLSDQLGHRFGTGICGVDVEL